GLDATNADPQDGATRNDRALLASHFRNTWGFGRGHNPDDGETDVNSPNTAREQNLAATTRPAVWPTSRSTSTSTSTSTERSTTTPMSRQGTTAAGDAPPETFRTADEARLYYGAWGLAKANGSTSADYDKAAIDALHFY